MTWGGSLPLQRQSGLPFTMDVMRIADLLCPFSAQFGPGAAVSDSSWVNRLVHHRRGEITASSRQKRAAQVSNAGIFRIKL